MNGWWWDPAGPGRGFFVEYADCAVRVACCGYDSSGAPQWQVIGPVTPDADGAIVADGFRLVFTDHDRARLEWRGERIELRHQHSQLRRDSVSWDSPFSGWRENGPRVFICEQLNRRLFAALLDDDGWMLLEASGKRDAFTGDWTRYEGGQAPGSPYRAPQGRALGPGKVTRDADGALRVKLPDGQSVRFTRPRLSREEVARRAPAARPLEVIFARRDNAASSGLVPLSLEAQGGAAFEDTRWELVLESTDARVPRFRSRVHVDGWPRKMALMLNTHLLPNGTVPLTLRLLADGREAWRHDLQVMVSNQGALAEKVRASLAARAAPLVIVDSVDSSHFDIDDPALRAWFDRPDAAEHIAALRKSGRIDAQEEQALRQFVEEGYLVLPDAIEEPLLERIDAELEEAVKKGAQGYSYGSSQRIRNLHNQYRGVRSLWTHPKVMRTLNLIFDVPARPCQTLTYVFGSQQEAHQDTVHLTPFPAGYMCGVWVALEDVKPDSGELEVFPGTHRLPRIYMKDAGCPKVTDENWDEFGEKVVTRYREMLKEGGFGKVTYRPKRGTILVWHENLLHGGSVRKDTSLSRRSIVSHYFADGAIAFYDSSGLPGHME